MLLQGAVGLQQQQDGAINTIRAGKSGEMTVSKLNPNYYELAYRGKIFTGGNQAAAALSLLSSTCTGLALWNPYGSNVNLVLLDICIAQATAPVAAASFQLEGVQRPVPGVAAPTGALTAYNTLLGSGLKANGVLSASCTLTATPTLIRAIGGGPVATSNIQAAFIRDEVAGAIIIGPGCSVNLGATTTAISVVASFTWAELPVS